MGKEDWQIFGLSCPVCRKLVKSLDIGCWKSNPLSRVDCQISTTVAFFNMRCHFCTLYTEPYYTTFALQWSRCVRKYVQQRRAFHCKITLGNSLGHRNTQWLSTIPSDSAQYTVTQHDMHWLSTIYIDSAKYTAAQHNKNSDSAQYTVTQHNTQWFSTIYSDSPL